MRDVHIECVTHLVSQVCLLLPLGFNINALLDCVKLVIKHHMELRRDMACPWIENKGHRLGVLAGVSKEDTHSGSVRPLLLATHGALQWSFQDKGRAAKGVLMAPEEIVCDR